MNDLFMLSTNTKSDFTFLDALTGITELTIVQLFNEIGIYPVRPLQKNMSLTPLHSASWIFRLRAN